MSRVVTLTVTPTAYSVAARRARDIGRGTKPEDVLQDWIDQAARESSAVNRKFLEAGRIVDRRLAAGGGNDPDEGRHDLGS